MLLFLAAVESVDVDVDVNVEDGCEDEEAAAKRVRPGGVRDRYLLSKKMDGKLCSEQASGRVLFVENFFNDFFSFLILFASQGSVTAVWELLWVLLSHTASCILSRWWWSGLGKSFSAGLKG